MNLENVFNFMKENDLTTMLVNNRKSVGTRIYQRVLDFDQPEKGVILSEALTENGKVTEVRNFWKMVFTENPTIEEQNLFGSACNIFDYKGYSIDSYMNPVIKTKVFIVEDN